MEEQGLGCGEQEAWLQETKEEAELVTGGDGKKRMDLGDEQGVKVTGQGVKFHPTPGRGQGSR